MSDAIQIRLRYIEISEKTLSDAMMCGNYDKAKDKALALLNIDRIGEDTYTSAWLRAMANENGLKHSTPCHPAIAQAVLNNVGAARFMWFMA